MLYGGTIEAPPLLAAQVVIYQCDATPGKMEIFAEWGALKPNEHLGLFDRRALDSLFLLSSELI